MSLPRRASAALRTLAFSAALPVLAPSPARHCVCLRSASSARPAARTPTRRPRLVCTMAPTPALGDVLAAPRVSALAVSGGAPLGELAAELLVVGVWGEGKKEKEEEGAWALPVALDVLGADVVAALGAVAADAGFSAKAGSAPDMVRVGGAVKRIVLYGLGDPKADGAMMAVSNAAAYAVAKGIAVKKCAAVGLAIVGDGPAADAKEVVERVVEGAQIAGYTDERYKEKKTEAAKVPTELVLAGAAGVDVAELGLKGEAIASGVVTTKEVVAAPANFLNPTTMALAAKQIAQEEGLECKVLGRAECDKLGMGSFLGVAQGCETEPQFIHMVYKPEGGATKKLVVVGKSVCHDTGGYNLKAGAGSMIELMKWDMGGGGTTLGLARSIGMIKPKGVEVHFIMPAVLNLVSSSAYLPGDILTASNGKTIEVLNTDAEGRLCLCDAIVYAEKVVPDLDGIVDVATLTGACIVALGNGMAGMWSTSDKLANDLLAAAKHTEDKMWRMPLPEEYSEQLKSKIADLRNIGQGRAAGSITAALFLKEFVKTKEWAHLDIAGTAWNDKKGGATGYGVRTLTNWIQSHSS